MAGRPASGARGAAWLLAFARCCLLGHVDTVIPLSRRKENRKGDGERKNHPRKNAERIQRKKGGKKKEKEKGTKMISLPVLVSKDLSHSTLVRVYLHELTTREN